MNTSINFKNWALALFAIFLVAPMQAQDIEEFSVNGMKVLLKPSKKQVVSAKIFFKGGTENYGPGFQGIELLTLRMLAEASSTNMTKDEFNSALESTGTSISGTAGYDYGTLSLTCLTDYWNDAWRVFSDVTCNPSWDEAEFQKIKAQMGVAAEQAASDPDTHLRNTAMQNTFGDGPYSRIPEGTVESIASLEMNNIQDYMKQIGKTDKAFLVVVGNVDKDDLMKKVEQLTCIKQLPSKPSPMMKGKDSKISENAYGEENREIATNYIRGLMGAPAIGGKEESAMRVAMSIMGDKMFEEVRTKRNLSYAPAAFFPSGVLKHAYTAMYVSTTKPNETITVMTDEFKRIRQEGFDPQDLINKKGEFMTQFFMGNETNSSQAEAIGRYENVTSYKRMDTFIDEVNSLTVEDLNAVFRKYATNVNWTYLGDTSIVDKDVFLAPLVTVDEKANNVMEAAKESMEKGKKKRKRKKKKKQKKLIGF